MSKGRRGPWAGIGVVAAGLAGVAFRCWLTAADAPPTNSDEATFGLIALHLLRGAEFPVFLYGQHYMGTLESYLAAPLVALFGPTTAALRTGPLICYGLFLVAMYATVRRLYSPGLAVLTVAVLALGSDRVVKDQVIADGSAELAMLTVLLILLATLAATGPPRRRLLLTGLWGVTAGFALWDHMLVLPYLFASTVVLWYACPRGTRRRAGLVATAGLMLGALPMLVHNLSVSWGNNSLSVLLHYNTVGPDAPLLDRLHAGILVGIPLATGLCDPGDCQPWQLAWAPVYLALLVGSGVFAVQALRRAEGADRVREAARLALVIGALATVAAYGRSPAAAEDPIESARYLSLLPVSTPAVLWPLWLVATRARPRWSRALATASLAVLGVAMLSATVTLAAHAPGYRSQARQQRELVQALDRLDVTRYYTDYWTCNRLAYATGERAVCAVLADGLSPGFNRYRPYWDVVAAADTVAYVAPAGSAFDRNVHGYLEASGVPVTVTEVAGYRIYLPDRAVRPPL